MGAICSCGGNEPESRLPEETVECSVDTDEAVDLGLSVKWASTNVSSYYYYWADTKALRDYDSYDYEEPFDESITCYSGSQYDVARMSWGGSWRTPTSAEWNELRNKCKIEWDGKGMKVTGSNGASIYLPANAPYGRYAIYYWSSSRVKGGDWDGSPAAVFISEFGMTKPDPAHPRSWGRVRPVCD